MKKLICMLALAGIGYGTVYAAILQQAQEAPKVKTTKKATKVKVHKKTTKKTTAKM